jgi:hypothetical protein
LSRGESTTALSTPVVPSLDAILEQQHTLYQSPGTYSRGRDHLNNIHSIISIIHATHPHPSLFCPLCNPSAIHFALLQITCRLLSCSVYPSIHPIHYAILPPHNNLSTKGPIFNKFSNKIPNKSFPPQVKLGSWWKFNCFHSTTHPLTPFSVNVVEANC